MAWAPAGQALKISLNCSACELPLKRIKVTTLLLKIYYQGNYLHLFHRLFTDKNVHGQQNADNQIIDQFPTDNVLLDTNTIN